MLIIHKVWTWDSSTITLYNYIINNKASLPGLAVVWLRLKINISMY